MIKYSTVNSSPAHLMIPTLFHSSEQEKIWAGHPLASLSFLSHWTLLVKGCFFWNNTTLSMKNWFSLVSITNYPLQKFHLTLHLLFLHPWISGCSIQLNKMADFPEILSTSKFPGRYWKRGREQLIQVSKTMDYLLIQKTTASLEKKPEPLYFPSSNAASIQLHFHFEPKHN